MFRVNGDGAKEVMAIRLDGMSSAVAQHGDSL